MAASRYNGVKLPALPEWDTAAYPYAHIQYITYRDGSFIAHLRCSDLPFHAGSGTVTVPAGAVMLVQSCIKAGTEPSWGTAYAVMNPSLALDGDTVIWCNTDIPDESGAIFLAASEPVPVQAVTIPDFHLNSWLTGFVIGLSGRPMWRVLFEGDLTTVVHSSYNGCCISIDGLLLSDDPAGIYRLTVDGVSISRHAPVFTDDGAGGIWDTYTLGNLHLVDGVWPDTGEDFGLCTIDPSQTSVSDITSSMFLSREPGTYHVKIEKIAI